MVQVYQTRHGAMMAEENDRYLGRMLRELGEFGEAQVELFRSFLTPESVVCDVGANVGALTVPLARMARYVHAFEPQRHVFHMLAGNVALNRLQNVSCYHLALGDEEARREIPVLDYERPNNSLGSFSLDMPGQKNDYVRIARLKTPCHFLKIDVEGYEVQVLRGAAPMIRECEPVIYVENDRRDQADEVIAEVRALGYTPYWHITPLFRPDNFRGVKADPFGDDLHSFDMLCTAQPIETNLPEAQVGDYDRLQLCSQGENRVAA
jgi:FkbM family methyltransferase